MTSGVGEEDFELLVSVRAGEPNPLHTQVDRHSRRRCERFSRGEVRTVVMNGFGRELMSDLNFTDERTGRQL